MESIAEKMDSQSGLAMLLKSLQNMRDDLSVKLRYSTVEQERWQKEIDECQRELDTVITAEKIAVDLSRGVPFNLESYSLGSGAVRRIKIHNVSELAKWAALITDRVADLSEDLTDPRD